VSVILLDALLIGVNSEVVAWVDWRNGYAQLIPPCFALWDSDLIHKRPLIDD
jgi:hypothetical protein